MPIRVNALHHTYLAPGAPARPVLRGVELEIRDGERLAIVGPARSGKSTLALYLAGLLIPAPGAGRVEVDGVDTRSRAGFGAGLGVGMVFQYPEDQLFSLTVADDVAFGPRNQGLPAAEVSRRVNQALSAVGLDPQVFGPRPIHALSGGEKRRVAIAGVLALAPRVILFDEPTAGLDPQGREELLALLQRLHRELGLTLVVISNHLEEVARLAQRVVVLAEGRVAMAGPTREVLGDAAALRARGLEPPEPVTLMAALAAAGLPVRTDRLTVAEVCDELAAVLRARQEAAAGAHLEQPAAGEQPTTGAQPVAGEPAPPLTTATTGRWRP